MTKNLWKMSKRALEWDERPLVMGILNVTPDSFSDGGKYVDVEAAVARAIEMEAQGADIIDVGGESTRPKANPVSVEEELRRVVPVIEKIASAVKIPISVDTTKAEVARRAIEAGAEIVNDVSGGEWDASLWGVVASTNAGYVLMHCKGRPVDGFAHEAYADVVREVIDYLEQRLAAAEKAGIERERIVCDPGFGFGKSAEESLALLADLDRLAVLGRPVLAGVSRKSFVAAKYGAGNLAAGTVATQVVASMRGAAILRVHDIPSATASAQMTG